MRSARHPAAVLILLFPFSLTAAAPQVWFCPLDPLLRPEVNYGGSPQYMSLFAPDAPWTTAASRVNVFKIYPQWIGSATDADLQTQFADLNRRGIALALEYGVLTASAACGKGVEGFGGQTLLNAAQRIQRNGGTLRYVAMDEPIFFSTLYTGANACRWTVDQMAANAAANIAALRTQFPDVLIGDIEPFPVTAPNWLAQYQAGIEALTHAFGFKPVFFDADVLWDTPGYLDSLDAVHKMLTGEGVPFGIIYDGNSTDGSDAAWIQSATQHMLSVELSLGSPDLVIFQSWHAYPRKLLPESDADSFTSLIDAYFRARTTLTAAVAGGSVQGTLTASASGQALANAPVAISLTPVTGSGVAAVYAAGATAPPGTQSIVFGARVNMECNCSGAADFLVTSFLLTGAAAPVTAGFANQLAGWGVSTPGTPAASAKIESGGLHVLAAAGQPVLLNSAEFAFTGTGPVTFRVSARVAPQSAGAGYFTAIFLGASGEIARTHIPFAAAELPVAAVATDAAGRFTAALPSTPADSFQVRAAYPGDAATWPAQAAAPYPSPAAQTIAIAAIANAASYDVYAVSPGEIVAVFGSGMGPAALAGGTFAGGFLGTSIAGVTVRFDGIAAPLIYASAGQIAAIVPYGIHPDQTFATVSTPGGVSLPFGIPVVAAVPGLFTADASGSGPLAALNADGTRNSPANPARSGLAVVVFGTGEGQTSPAGVDGLVMNVPAAPLLAPAVTVGGVPATVDYFGSAPGEVAGVFQLNFRVPANAPRGDGVPVTVLVGGAGAAKTTTLAIR